MLILFITISLNKEEEHALIEQGKAGTSWGPQPESQKPRQHVSNADRKVFANPESFCNKLIIGWRISGYFAIQNIQIICKVSGWTGKFPDDLKKCRDELESFQMI